MGDTPGIEAGGLSSFRAYRRPGKMKKILAERHINFYTIDGIKIGKEIGLGGRINTVLQSAFFKIADIILPTRAMGL